MSGVEIIRATLETLPRTPGVYRMLNKCGEALYIGKARDLKKRVMSYTVLDKLSPRLQKMVQQTVSLDITTTRTEAEALLLEASLIKSLKPRYNILLRDDKSYPYIAITAGHEFPRIAKHRGVRKKGALYFGPYASAGDVNRVIAMLQKSFLLRSCPDAVFASRSRPCLEYQIKRCSAPCARKISSEDYAKLVGQAKRFLSGKSREVQAELIKTMEEASELMAYEKAAVLRDRLRALAAVQAGQFLQVRNVKNADVVGLYGTNGEYCIQVFFLRGGTITGSRTYFPLHTEGCAAADVMEAFLGRFYQMNTPPLLILLSHDVHDRRVLKEALVSLAKQKVNIVVPLHGNKRPLVETAIANARDALMRKHQEETVQASLLEKVRTLFGIDEPLRRIEVYDNSHIMGRHAVGAMIVAGSDGFQKNAYRKFTVHPGQSSTGGDDYAMLREVLMRRFRYMKEKEDAPRPGLVLIDGGLGQLSVAEEVFADLGLADIPVVCIAKGPDRNAGREQFFQPGKSAFTLPAGDPVLHYLQRLRDEAHRFAVMAHRAKRTKSVSHSKLDMIPGIGRMRKKALLYHFGSFKGVEEASLEELQRVSSINRQTAWQIYSFLHDVH